MSEPLEFFVTAAKGTEGALRDELRELRIPKVRADRGGVHFQGDWEDAWRVCLQTRIGLRVLRPLASFEAPDERWLYDGVRAIDFTPYLSPHHSLAVTAFCRSSGLTHTNFVAQKVKDAVVDAQRDRTGARSSVDRRDPDVHLFCHLVQDQATIYLDLASESLHRRGFRKQAVEAPLKENVAAALVRLSGWDRQSPFCDPMCGSGTIAIEAAMLAGNRAPGLSRKRFGFERWANFDRSTRNRLADLRRECAAAAILDLPDILAGDNDPSAVSKTRTNARAAGVALQLRGQSVLNMAPLDPPGWVVTNPPYGQRLETNRKFYQDLGTAIRRWRQHTVGVLAGRRGVEHMLGLKPEKFQIVFNGDIECRWLLFRIWS